MSVFRYVRLFTGHDGTSHFEELAASLEKEDFTPPAAPLLVGALGQATGSFLVVGGSGGWHGRAPSDPEAPGLLRARGPCEDHGR